MYDQIFEFRWKDEKNPCFRVVRNGSLAEKVTAFGTNVSLEIRGIYSCSGYEKNGEYYSCISGGAQGTRKCEECKKHEGMSAAQYCDGFNTEIFSGEELKSLNCPHYLYFALFDHDLIKVGVSSSGRGFLRQIEQGTEYCMIVAEGMWGVPARQMETIIRKNGMIDKVQGSQKKDIMFPDITEEKAKNTLMGLFEKHIPFVIAQKPEFEQYLKNPPEIKGFSEYYHLSQAKAVQKPMHDTDLLPMESVSGTLIAAKGSFLLIETDSDKVLINAKKLKGCAVDFSAKPIGLKKEDAFQGALF